MVKNNALTIINLTQKIAGLMVLDNLNLNIKKNRIQAIIGPNGAGKTTLVNVITGFLKPTNGKVMKDEETLIRLSPAKIVQRGIQRTFQNLELGEKLTVRENLLYPFIPVEVRQFFKNFFNGLHYFKKITSVNNLWINFLIENLNLQVYLDKKVNKIPYGIKKKVELARALLNKPSILILDEPVAGLTPSEKKEIKRFLKKIQVKEKITLLIIEHDMNFLQKLAEQVYVLQQGRLIFSGSLPQVLKNKTVSTAYLGKKKF